MPTHTWKANLESKLKKNYGSKKTLLLNKYVDAFPNSYIDDYPVEIALQDVAHLERLSAEQPIYLFFYNQAHDNKHFLHLRLYQWQQSIPLSDILPILENLDLRTESERPYRLKIGDDQIIWISDFCVKYTRNVLKIAEVNELFQEAFTHLYFKKAENDGFNKLILGAQLSLHQVVIFRSYAKYLKQIEFRFSQAYIENALINHTEIARDLIELFYHLHDPAKQKKAKQTILNIEEKILVALEKVSSLDEDRIIRIMMALIKATQRTNYFKKTTAKIKEYLAIKINSRALPDLPLPVPLYEIFIYSYRFEGIHLRNTKVARGGIRWSDRREDFRTEILGLMKAQVVKNAVIVPSGAKGGFVLKMIAADAPRQQVQLEVIDCYKLFISGLLDLTDNIKNDKVIHPADVVCHDDDDPYLVVAADKGTATFSDTANALAAQYDFWLDDAFASGGSMGYDHKKMGITARGAWESVKRHFRELEIDILQSDITVIGIGDMSGDVFGNGMLYSPHIKLLAAFDHRNIFLDPNPDAILSFNERKRLFNLPTSSWEDYNPKLISKGGGVFKRSLKSINLSSEMKKVLDVSDNTFTPNELIRVILKAPVDLFFNGGIGTYVKAEQQSHADVGDRTNDYCRVNGNELRCKVVGEGGNLGFTQLGRVEYAQIGGLINTDFIDNSAGVDCSDHEVNLKILLNKEIQQGKLNYKKRNNILVSLTEEVASLVLQDNYYQALVMSFSYHHAKKNIGLHAAYIKDLEINQLLDRQVEFLPDDKKLLERKAAGEGLTRPELAVLLAYTKINIKHEILKSNLPEIPYVQNIIETGFPFSIRKKYAQAIKTYRLNRDMCATQLSNQIVNEMGITFVYRLQIETGAKVEEIVRAHMVASSIFNSRELKSLIETLDFRIPISQQYEMLFNIRNLINLSTRWFLRTHYLNEDLQQWIAHFSEQVLILEKWVPLLMSGKTKEYLAALKVEFLTAGLDKSFAERIATYRAIYTALNIIDVAAKHKFDLVKTAKVYFAAGEKLNLVWFRDQIANDSREGHWNALARLTLRDELDVVQRALTITMIQIDKKETDTQHLIDKWALRHQTALERWEKLLADLHSSNIDYTMFFIAMRELLGLMEVSHSH